MAIVSSKNHWYEKIRQEFLLSFFNSANEYEEKEINGYILIKQFNAKSLKWEVAIYTQKSYQKRKNYNERTKNLFVTRGNK